MRRSRVVRDGNRLGRAELQSVRPAKAVLRLHGELRFTATATPKPGHASSVAACVSGLSGGEGGLRSD